ncbi:MAG: hypothetical protein DHS20C18_51110 [Saprospiraceae bacterium]|nr:MAG: hypothetical protein DHS20C18_51110 [Saprospiraceae bacterium]
MEKLFLQLERGKVQCYRFGKGPDMIIAMHGFARSGALFQPMAAAMGEAFSIYAPDLPFHGNTEWSPASFDRNDIRELIYAICALNPGQKFYWMGYSLGGRLVLSQWTEFKDQLAGLVLMAPDGFGTKALAIPERIPLPLRKWICRLFEKPAWFLALTNGLRQVGVINKWVYQYLEKNLSTAENRQRLLGVWLSVGHFRMENRKGAKPEFPVSIVMGRQDKIVPPKVAHQLKKLLPEAVLIWRDCGHQLISREMGQILKDQIRPVVRRQHGEKD